MAVTQYAFDKQSKRHLDEIFLVDKPYEKRKKQLRDFLKTENLLVSRGNPDFETQAAILHQRLTFKMPNGTFDSNLVSILELQEYDEENPAEKAAVAAFKKLAESHRVPQQNVAPFNKP